MSQIKIQKQPSWIGLSPSQNRSISRIKDTCLLTVSVNVTREKKIDQKSTSAVSLKILHLQFQSRRFKNSTTRLNQELNQESSSKSPHFVNSTDSQKSNSSNFLRESVDCELSLPYFLWCITQKKRSFNSLIILDHIYEKVNQVHHSKKTVK